MAIVDLPAALGIKRGRGTARALWPAGTGTSIAAGALALGVASIATVLAGDFAAFVPPVALLVYAGVATTIVATIAFHHPHDRFGIANAVTLARAVLACLFAGVLADSGRIGAPDMEWIAWAGLGLVALSAALDGVDGFFARRQRLTSRFGARFDMEIDAFFILLLCLFAWQLGKAGGWIVLIGAMRYLFIFAQATVPALSGDLPPSLRRKAVCVLQYAALGALMAPVVEDSVATTIALVALLALIGSFLWDVRWLLARSR